MVRNAGGSVSTHYLLRNHLGSTAAVASGGGTLQRRISYGAWGNFVNPATGRGSVASGTIAGYTTVTYTGHELIAGADLINMGARLYDPKSGLFMSPDPTVARPYDPMDLNQYAYVGDNPMSGVDLWGLSEDFTVKYPPIHVTGSYASCPSGWVGQHEPDCYPLTAFLSGGGPGGGGFEGAGGGGRGIDRSRPHNHCYISKPKVGISPDGTHTDVITRSSTINVTASTNSVFSQTQGFIVPSRMTSNGGVMSNMGALGWEKKFVAGFVASEGLGNTLHFSAGLQRNYPYGIDWAFNFARTGGLPYASKGEASKGEKGDAASTASAMTLDVSVPGCQE